MTEPSNSGRDSEDEPRARPPKAGPQRGRYVETALSMVNWLSTICVPLLLDKQQALPVMLTVRACTAITRLVVRWIRARRDKS